MKVNKTTDLNRLNKTIEKNNELLEKLISILEPKEITMIRDGVQVAANDAIMVGAIELASNYKDLMDHDNAQIEVIQDNVFLTDRYGCTHQINTKTKNPNSKYIDRISYLTEKNELEIKFKKNKTYRYSSDDSEVFSNLIDAFLSSDRVDQDFHPLIRNNNSISYRRV